MNQGVSDPRRKTCFGILAQAKPFPPKGLNPPGNFGGHSPLARDPDPFALPKKPLSGDRGIKKPGSPAWKKNRISGLVINPASLDRKSVV
jgi:hypothetical protein